MARTTKEIPKIENDGLRAAFKETKSYLISKLNHGLRHDNLRISATYPLSHKTISEIGGRIIEEYVTALLERGLQKEDSFKLVPTASRSLGDFVLECKSDKTYRFYFDVKAQHLSIRERTEEHYKSMNIQAKKPGESHPNLIAYHKARDFFIDTSRSKEDIAFLLIHYDPKVEGNEVSFNLRNLSDSSMFLLRDISESNLSFGNLGKGQLQLKRINDLRTESRTRSDFITLIEKLESTPRRTRASGRN